MSKEIIIDFGDIYYSEIKNHFFLMLGTTEGGFFYRILTSRVYRPFEIVRELFNNHCNFCGTFKKYFPKDSDTVIPVRLKDCFFIDKEKYAGCLTYESLVTLQNDLSVLTKKDYENFKFNDKFNFVTCLDKADIEVLYVLIRNSDNISPEKKEKIKKSYKIVKEKFNKQERLQREKEALKKIKKMKKAK